MTRISESCRRLESQIVLPEESVKCYTSQKNSEREIPTRVKGKK